MWERFQSRKTSVAPSSGILSVKRPSESIRAKAVSCWSWKRCWKITSNSWLFFHSSSGMSFSHPMMVTLSVGLYPLSTKPERVSAMG